MAGGFGLLAAISPLFLSIFTRPAVAQAITADSSLSTRITSSGSDFTIHDGTRSGTNLFHSFSEFSVPLNGSATFTNPDNIINIVGRVTGGTLSDLNGKIQANGQANLFLLNPNGIVIGPGAQLKIGGSFIGSTAENIAFSDETVFSTRLGSQAPMLTINTPTGLQLGASSGAIATTGGAHKLDRLDNGAMAVRSASTLTVAPKRTLALIGNGVSLGGGRISTTGGQLALGSVASGEVKFSPAGTGYSFDYTKVSEFADVSISQALVDGINPGGGLIQLQGRDISVLDGAEVYIQNQAPVNTSGGIAINASRQFKMTGKSPITGISSAVTVESFRGLGGNLDISAQSIVLLGSIGVESIAILAPGGDVAVNATDSIAIMPSTITPNNTTGIDTLSFSPDYAAAPAGDLTVETNQLTVLGGSTVASLAYGAGDSGDVVVKAKSIKVEGVDLNRFRPSIITSGTLGSGNAGNVQVNTERLDVSAGGRIDSSTSAAGSAGSVTINATQAVTVSGRVAGSINPSFIISGANLLDDELKLAFNLPPFPKGDSGDLTINTPLLSVTEGAQVTVRNDGTGKGGTLRINAGSVQLWDAGITASTQAGGGGNIDITSTSPILLRSGSLLSAAAGGAGDGGNIMLNTPFLIALENSDIVASAFEGDGGNIQIFAQSLIGTAFREEDTAKSDITASSQFGVSGVVTISNLEVDPSSGVVELPDNIADYSNQISAGCADAQRSQFTASGRGGLALNPTQQVDAHRLWNDVRETPDFRRSAQRPAEQAVAFAEPLVEASDWRTNRDGNITLLTDDEAIAIAPAATASCLANRET